MQGLGLGHICDVLLAVINQRNEVTTLFGGEGRSN